VGLSLPSPPPTRHSELHSIVAAMTATTHALIAPAVFGSIGNDSWREESALSSCCRVAAELVAAGRPGAGSGVGAAPIATELEDRRSPYR
jgi:hypothetical protein